MTRQRKALTPEQKERVDKARAYSVTTLTPIQAAAEMIHRSYVCGQSAMEAMIGAGIIHGAENDYKLTTLGVILLNNRKLI
jgi:predicted transcriptional regulator